MSGVITTSFSALARGAVAVLPAGQDWEAAGHGASLPWIEWLGSLATLGFLAWFVFLVLRGVLRHGRYRAVGVLGPADVERVREAIVAAEKRTVGEILPVIVARSDRHPGSFWISALVVSLLGTSLLAPWLPWDRPFLLLACQVGLGLLGFGGAALLPGYRRAFVSEERATEMAEEQAFQEFYRHGLHRTAAQTGVLLFVSLFEHRAIVIADEGIDARVDAEQWARTNAAILEGIAGGSLRDGVIAGIESAAEVLAEHFPWQEGDRNEIPDRVIVREE